jgi:hypothetical protein
MTRVCIVKQHTTYDLFTRTGPDLSAIVASSNWRSGPIGLWEAFETSARIVTENPECECRLGKRQWSRYVEGWDLWPAGSTAESADTIDWSEYDIVISIDVAIPTHIVRCFPSVMWCYYFIEGGPTGIDGPFRGSPFFAYNVFLNHRLAKSPLSPAHRSLRQMQTTRRAVLDFPYYMQSAHSVRTLYPELATETRAGVCLSHHSRTVLTEREGAALAEIGPVRTEWTTIADIHRAEIRSKYFVVHPAAEPMAGVALIEAVSAGCLVLAPVDRVWGFPELLTAGLDFQSVSGLLEIVHALESDHELYEEVRVQQESRVEEWCFRNPARNLETMLRAFRSSTAAPGRQRRAEAQARVVAIGELAALRIAHRARRAARSVRFVGREA